MAKQQHPASAAVFLFFTLIGLSTPSAYAFESILVEKETEHYPLGLRLAYLEDRDANLSIKEIRNPSLAGRWRQNQTKVPAFGFTSSVYWFAVELKNAYDSPFERLLAVSYPLLDSIEVYLDHDGKVVERFGAGDRQPFVKRPIEHRHFLFPIQIPKGDPVTVYLRVQTSSSMQIPISLWSERGFWKANHRSSIAQGLYFGIMLAMILYNLFIYTAVRDRSYIFYVLFVSCFAVIQLTVHGFAYRYFWPQFPWFNEKILIISVCATLTFGGLFTTSLLGLKTQSATFYRLITLTTLIAALNIVASLPMHYTAAIGISLAISLVMSSFSLAAGCMMWHRGYAPARYYTIAWTGFLLGTMAYVLSKIGAMPRNPVTENGIQVGSAIEVMLLSFALANRINVIRREKDLAQAESVSILKKYRALYENAIEGIFKTTLAYDFDSANRAMSRIIGLLNKDSVLSKKPYSLRTCFSNQAEADKFCQLLRDRREVINHEFRGQSTDGREFWASISARTVYGESGKPQYYEGSLVDITERRQAEEQVRYLAYYDKVTGLPNRALLQDLLKHALDRAKRNNEPLAVLFVDLNRFKMVNDTLGHNAGDRLLQEVAERLNHCLRGGDWLGRPQSVPDSAESEDSIAGDAVARLGGDEFVMVLTEIRHAEDAAIVAQRIGEVLANSFLLEGKEVYISASIGISTYPMDSDNPDILLKQADAAMYHVKKQGGDGYQFYTDFLSVHASKRLTLETELRKALSEEQFRLYYQPKVDLQSSQIVGLEALCRWQHPKRGLVSPIEFIGPAEENGLIVPLGEWVLRTACIQTQAWRDARLRPIRVSVNLSARQFNEPELSKTILRALEDSGLDPHFLELELTESLLMDDSNTTSNLLDELKKMGLYISIDDFGTGYSSLGYLKRLPVDALKIDRCIIHDITRDADNQAITAAIISMARQLTLKVIAEGVETEEQLSFLRACECDEVQGFFLSVPLPADGITDLLRRADPLFSRKAIG